MPSTSKETLGIYIEIQELENGFVVHFFSQHGSSKFDKNTYYPTILDALTAIQNWVKAWKEGEESIGFDK